MEKSGKSFEKIKKKYSEMLTQCFIEYRMEYFNGLALSLRINTRRLK